MRDKAQNDYLLKLIGRDLSAWEKGDATHANYGIGLGMGVWFLFGFCILNFISLEGWVFVSALLIWTTVCGVITWWLFRRFGVSWAEEVDFRLAKYHPADLQAWEELKLRVAEEGITLQAVQQWADQEMRATTPPPPAEQKWKMLQNKRGSTAIPEQEQPVKPDAKVD